MNLQLLADRFEIRALIVCYSNALDARRFGLLDEIFTADAYIDYRATGGIDGRYPMIRAWLPAAVTAFPHMCHLVGNISIVLSGDQAQARTLCLNPVAVPLPAGGAQVMFLAMWYRDRLLRTAAGWRMAERVQEGGLQHNVPHHLAIPAAAKPTEDLCKESRS
jgi:hypothetical protein